MDECENVRGHGGGALPQKPAAVSCNEPVQAEQSTEHRAQHQGFKEPLLQLQEEALGGPSKAGRMLLTEQHVNL